MTVDILLVEDSDAEALLALRALQKVASTAQVKRLCEGAEALDFLLATGKYIHRTDEDRPKLILLDINLPKINGLEVLKRVKGNPSTHAIPVVMLTNSTVPTDKDTACRYGADDYRQKPLDMGEFTRLLADVLRRWLR